jgi:hypothetical protein
VQDDPVLVFKDRSATDGSTGTLQEGLGELVPALQFLTQPDILGRLRAALVVQSEHHHASVNPVVLLAPGK